MVTTLRLELVNSSTMEDVSVRFLSSAQSFQLNNLDVGNNNKYKSMEECEDTCVENEFKLKMTNKCEQSIEPGPWYNLERKFELNFKHGY